LVEEIVNQTELRKRESGEALDEEVKCDVERGIQ
jgi:hypothetical protein